MNTWPKDELRKIAAADDLHILPFREDGRTGGRTALPRGFGLLSSMTRFTFVRTTVRDLVGTGLRGGRRRVGLPWPA